MNVDDTLKPDDPGSPAGSTPMPAVKAAADAEGGLPADFELPGGRFAGREAFQQLVRNALACAARDGWQEIILSDATFEDWPLRERAVVDSLRAWSKTGRRLVLLATRFDGIERNQPRFATWRKAWSHIIECRQCRTADSLDFPSAIWSRTWVMQRLDLARSTGVSGSEPDRRVMLRELLDEKLRASTAGFPASTLGL
jgi:hypothetical protein